MKQQAKDLHEKIERDLLEIMDNSDNIIRKIHNLHNLEYDYGRYIFVMQEIKLKAKKMLQYDFDRLALLKKIGIKKK